jgi:hypothetical protein
MNYKKLATDKIFKAMICFFAIMAFYFYLVGGLAITMAMSVIFVIVSGLYLGILNIDNLYLFLKKNKIIQHQALNKSATDF